MLKYEFYFMAKKTDPINQSYFFLRAVVEISKESTLLRVVRRIPLYGNAA